MMCIADFKTTGYSSRRLIRFQILNKVFGNLYIREYKAPIYQGFVV